MLENWNKSARSNPKRVVMPGSVDELVAVVKNHAEYPSPVRAAGHLHSTTFCIEADGGTQVLMQRFGEIQPSVDGATLTVGAGVTMLQIRDALRALPTPRELAVSPEIGNATAGSVACSGSKDSWLTTRPSPGFAQIGSAVVKVRMVDASGDVLVVDEHGATSERTGQQNPDLTLSLVRCSYGLLGIIFEVELETAPLVLLETRYESIRVADRFDETNAAAGAIYVRKKHEIFAGCHAVLAFLQPYEGRILVERRTVVNGGAVPTPADNTRRAIRDWIWEWGASEATTWSTALAGLLSGDAPAMRKLLASGVEGALATATDNALLQGLTGALAGQQTFSEPLAQLLLDNVAKIAGETAPAPGSPLSGFLLALFDQMPQPVFEAALRGFRGFRSDSLVDFTNRRATFFDFTFWAFPQDAWDEIVPLYIKFCRDYTRQHDLYRPALFTEIYFICQDTRSLLSFSKDKAVFTLDMVDNRPTDSRWHAMNEAYNNWAVKIGGKPLLNQTKRLEATPSVVRQAYGADWTEFSDKVWRANAPIDDAPNGRFVSGYFSNLLNRRMPQAAAAQ